jgi:hypothetical protein
MDSALLLETKDEMTFKKSFSFSVESSQNSSGGAIGRVNKEEIRKK